MIYLKQSTASQEVLLGPFVDSTDGNTAETALTIANTDIKIHKAGATTLASKNSGGATHISNGNYYAVLDATDTDTLGSGCIVVQVAGALAVRHSFCVLAANVYDALIGGGDLLQVDTQQFGNAAGTFAAGVPAVNVAQISGDSTAADNLENAFDETAGPVPWLGIMDQGTAQAATSTTIQLRSADAFPDDALNGCVVLAFGSTQGYWQARLITDYVNSTDTATVDAWAVTPSGTVTYKVFAGPAAPSTLPNVNVAQISGDATAADNLENYCDGTTPMPVNATHFGGSAGTFASGRPEVNVNSLAANSVNASALAGDAVTEIQSGLATSSALSTVAGYVDTEVAAIKAVTDKLDTALEADGGVYRYTANALEQAPSGTGASAQSIVEAMFQNDSGETAASAVPGSAVYEIVQNAGGGSAPTVGEIADEVQTRTIAAVTTVNGLAANSVTAAALAADAVTEIQSGLATASALSTVAGYVDTEVAAIKAKTDNLPSDPADQSLIIAATDAVMTRLGAPAGASVSADIAAVKADTGAGATAAALTTVSNNVTAVKAKTDSLGFTVAGQVDANVQYVNDAQVTGNGQPGTEWGPA